MDPFRWFFAVLCEPFGLLFSALVNNFIVDLCGFTAVGPVAWLTVVKFLASGVEPAIVVASHVLTIDGVVGVEDAVRVHTAVGQARLVKALEARKSGRTELLY